MFQRQTLAIIANSLNKNILLKTMTKTEIAKAFSNGEFEKTNQFISELHSIKINKTFYKKIKKNGCVINIYISL